MFIKADRSTPVLPMYQGVKFIPKIAPKYQLSSNESDKLEELLKNRPIASSKYQQQQQQQQQQQTSSTNNTVLIDYTKKVGTQRTTPGKSTSFKHQLKPNASACAASNESTLGGIGASTSITTAHLKHQKQQNTSKKLPLLASTNAIGSSMHHQHHQHHPTETINITQHLFELSKDVNATSVSAAVQASKGGHFNESACSSNRGNISSSGNCNLTRKPSETKPLGLMHTELRALKRSEYDQQQKEKERMAMLLRRDLEEEKMRRQQEEIQKIRSQRHTFRSRPIKQYKAVEVKPSTKPLTEPKSPQLGTSLNQSSRLKSATSMLSLQYSAMTDALIDNSNLKKSAQNASFTNLKTVKNKLITASHEHLNTEYNF